MCVGEGLNPILILILLHPRLSMQCNTSLCDLPAEVQPQRQRGERSPESADKIGWNSALGCSGTQQLQQPGLRDSCCPARRHHRRKILTFSAAPNFPVRVTLSVFESVTVRLFTDLRLGCGLSWDASGVFHSNGRDGEGDQWPQSYIQVKEWQHPGFLQTQHHLL